MKKLILLAFLTLCITLQAQTPTRHTNGVYYPGTTVAPTTPAPKDGQVYYNKVDKLFYQYDGSVWKLYYDDTEIQAEVDLNTAKVTDLVHPLVETAVPVNALFTDTNTQLSDGDITTLGYIKTDTNTQLSDGDIGAFGYIKTYIDTNTQLSDGDISAFGYIKTDTDTQLTDGEITALGYIKTDTDTNTQLSDADITALGYIKIDTNTQRTDEEIQTVIDTNDAGFITSYVDTNTQLSDGDISGFGYIKTYTDTNTQLSDGDITALGYIKTDTNTQLSDGDIGAFGYIKTDNDTQLDLAGVQGLGFVTGAHTVDTDTQLSDGDISTLGYIKTYTDTNTQLSDSQVATAATNEGFVTGSHTINTDTVYDDTDIQAEVDLNTAKATNIAHPLVETAVPNGALFTDTVYNDTAIQNEVDLNTAKATNIAHPLVETAVPVGAVFTDADTVYDDTAIQSEVDDKQDILAEGAFVDGDKTKLNSIETGANITDTANVTSSGALMDTEVTNLAQVKSFDTTDYATASQGSTADTAEQSSNKNANGGYAGLDGSGKISSSQLPALAITDTFVVGSQAAMLALTVEVGDVAVRTDLEETFILRVDGGTVLGNWTLLETPTDAVASVFGRSGVVTAQANDYTWNQINKSTSSLANLTTRNYSDLQNTPTTITNTQASDITANNSKLTNNNLGVSEPYTVGWNADQNASTKNDVYDKIESLDFGDVYKVGTPTAGQIAYWTGNGTIKGHDAFIVDDTFTKLSLGIEGNGSQFGYLELFSGNGTDGLINFHNTDEYDTTVNIWRIKPYQGNFGITTDNNASDHLFLVDDATLAITVPKTTIADIDTLGDKALITREYLDAEITTAASGNSATATSLATARLIAGVSFDGTADISLNNNAITNGAGYITSYTDTNTQLSDGDVGAFGYIKTYTDTDTNTQLSDGDISAFGYIKDGNTNWNNSYGYVTSSGNTIIGTDSDINTSGAEVIDQFVMTDGVITSHSLRILTLANIGYTGASNANYITNNNQLTNGAGYISSYTDTDTQDLSISGNTISLTNGGSVVVPDANTQLSDGDVGAFGYIKTYTDTNTQLSDGDITTLGYIKDGNTGWDNSYGYVTSSGNTVIGTDGDIDTSGATIIDNLYMTDGVLTSHGTRTLTLANLGYTGATNANYITNNNQLTNGAGYTANVGDITGVTAGTNLTTGGTSGTVTLNVSSTPSFTSVNATNNYSINGVGVAAIISGAIALGDYDGDGMETEIYSDSNIKLETINDGGVKIHGDTYLQNGQITRSSHHTGHLEGSYNNIGDNSTKSNPIYTIGSSYNPIESTLSNMYGIGYSNASASFIDQASASGWGLYVAAAGDAKIFMSANSGNIHADGIVYGNSGFVANGGMTITQNGIAQVFNTTEATGGSYMTWNDGAMKGYFGYASTSYDNIYLINSEPAGHIILGTSGVANFTIDNTGDATFTDEVTAVDFINTSDRRLKDNIRDYSPKKIDVRWREYELKEDGTTQLGLVADEVEETHPEFVKKGETSEDMDGVRYMRVLIAKVAELEARLSKLEK
jgi:hypothetical protein